MGMRFRDSATSSVVPKPANGSKTTCPGWVHACRKWATKASAYRTSSVCNSAGKALLLVFSSWMNVRICVPRLLLYVEGIPVPCAWCHGQGIHYSNQHLTGREGGVRRRAANEEQPGGQSQR